MKIVRLPTKKETRPEYVRAAIERLMLDGRERTINDVELRVGAPKNVIRKILTSMVLAGRLKSFSLGGGADSISVYSQPKEASNG